MVLDINISAAASPASSVSSEQVNSRAERPSHFERGLEVVNELMNWGGLSRDEAIALLPILLSGATEDFIKGSHKESFNTELYDEKQLSLDVIRKTLKDKFPDIAAPDAAEQVAMIVKYAFNTDYNDCEIRKGMSDAYDPSFTNNVKKLQDSVGPEFVRELGIDPVFRQALEVDANTKDQPRDNARFQQVHALSTLVNNIIDGCKKRPQAIGTLPQDFINKVNAIVGDNVSVAAQALSLPTPLTYKKILVIEPPKFNIRNPERIIPHSNNTLHLYTQASCNSSSRRLYERYQVFAAPVDLELKEFDGYGKIATIQANDGEINLFSKITDCPIQSNIFFLGALANYIHSTLKISVTKTTYTLKHGGVTRANLKKYVVKTGLISELVNLRKVDVAASSELPGVKAKTFNVARETPGPETVKRLYKRGLLPMGEFTAASEIETRADLIASYALPEYLLYLQSSKISKTVRIIAGAAKKRDKNLVNHILSGLWERGTSVGDVIQKHALCLLRQREPNQLLALVSGVLGDVKIEFDRQVVDEGAVRIVSAIILDYLDTNGIRTHNDASSLVTIQRWDLDRPSNFKNNYNNNNRGRTNNNNNNQNWRGGRGRSQSQGRHGGRARSSSRHGNRNNSN